MKKIIYPIIFLLSVQIVLAMYGGETIKIFDEDCTNLTINVTVIPYQDKDEFKLSNCELLNYSNTSSNYRCNCSTIYFTPAFNSIGNYTFDFLYFYQEKEEVSSSSGGGGRGRRIIFKPIINMSKPKEPIYTIFCGNKICDKYENCSNCARDCGECIIKIPKPYCYDGDLRCADGTLLICKDDNWGIKEICECIDGECVKKKSLGLIIGIILIVLVTIGIKLFVYWFIKKRQLYPT